MVSRAPPVKQREMSRLEMGRRLNECEHLKQAEAAFAEIGAKWHCRRREVSCYH